MSKLTSRMRYLSVIVLALVALAATWLIPPLAGSDSSVLLLLAAIVVATGVAGWRAGLLATVVCLAGHVVYQVASGSDLVAESVRTTLFLCVAVLVLTLALLRSEAEESLGRSETQLRTILDKSLDPIGVVRDGVHCFVNPAYLRMFGYRHPEDLVGQSVLKVIAPDERPAILRRMDQRSREGTGEGRYDTRGVRSDGTPIDMEVHVSTYCLNGEQFSLVILRDVTERKRAFHEKELLIAELREALSKVKTLRGMLPTCASCRKIRDEQGAWHDMETYIAAHSEADFSHGLCPVCAHRLYPEVFGGRPGAPTVPPG